MVIKSLQEDKYNLIPVNNDATAVPAFTNRAAGTAWIIQVWKLLNRNQSPPHISGSFPKRGAVRHVDAVNRSPATTQAWETQLLLVRTCTLLIGGCRLLVLIPNWSIMSFKYGDGRKYWSRAKLVEHRVSNNPRPTAMMNNAQTVWYEMSHRRTVYKYVMVRLCWKVSWDGFQESRDNEISTKQTIRPSILYTCLPCAGSQVAGSLWGESHGTSWTVSSSPNLRVVGLWEETHNLHSFCVKCPFL